jgi:glycosyltransferase involved in cell wall biosynthesis
MIHSTVMHVVSRIHQESSGPTYSVMRLCEAQAKAGAKVELHVVKSAGQKSPLYSIFDHGSNPLSGKLCASSSLKRAMQFDYGEPRIVHSHGLWMMPNIYPAKIPQSSILVTSPRGTLSDWAWNRSYWIKRVAWLIGQKKMLRRSDCFHATAEHEVGDIRKRGFRQPVAVIPNGIDVPEIQGVGRPAHQRILLFLARLHPVKGLENLIRAWHSVGPNFQEWKLVIAGGGSVSYEKQLKELADSLKVERLEFCGSVYGSEKIKLVASADLYVLPSFTENFGVSVAEAMACGTPVITTDQTPWTSLPKQESGWCIEVGERALTECLQNTLAIDRAKLTEMGARARRWMQTDYSWNEIANKTLITYQWLKGDTNRPAWIRD